MTQTTLMFRKTLYGITVLTTLIFGYVLFDFYTFSKTQKAALFQMGDATSEDLRTSIDKVLTDVMLKSMELKKLLESDDFTQSEIENITKEYSYKLNTILGATIAYKPYAFNEKNKLYAPYFDKQQNSLIDLGKLYDYTNPELATSSWYTDIEKNGPQWVEPYYGQAAQALVSDYCVPFNYASGPNKGKFRGVLTLTISLKGFTELIHSLSLGKTGFGFVTSKKGQLLAHPINEYIGLKNISDLIAEETNKDLKTAYKQIGKGETGSVAFKDPVKKQNALFFYSKVPASDWEIGVQFYKEDLLRNQHIYKKKYIKIATISSLLFLLLLAVFYNRDYLSNREIWYLSIISSGVLLGNIFLVGYLQHTKANANIKNDSPPIIDKTALNNVINDQLVKSKKLAQPNKKVVPTGIYIERLEFEDSYNVNVSGYLWLKYDHAFVNEIHEGFLFSQTAPFAESSFVEKAYEKNEKNHKLIGYNFRTTLRMNFDYSDYPFDKRNIDIEIIPANDTDNILLVPDLNSYKYTNPSDKCGMNSKIKLSGSKILETYFNYTFFTYNTNFGFKENATFEKAPILHFNVNVREVLITAFVTYLIPIFVTLIMIFIFIFSTPRSKDGRIDGGAIVQGMTAFFFVLIFSHIDLRKSIETADLMYMEYFYFVTYIIIILATYNLITFSRIPHKIFDYEDNIIVKASYFPLFLLMVLGITLAKFY